jgi:iron uptake system component EfeO
MKVSIRAARHCIASALLAVPLVGAHAAAFDDSVERYRSYLIDNVESTLAGARTLRERIAANDLDGARHAWIEARIGWERSEVFTGGFVSDLDDKIDGWPDATTGFHAVEATLFVKGTTEGLKPEADKLVLWLTDLDIKVHKMPLTGQGMLDGTARLAYEIGESKADGGESRFSGTSLDDMVNNVDGLQRAYATVFAAPLEAKDATLAHQAQAQIATLATLVKAGDLKRLDADKLRAASEDLVVTLQAAATTLGYRRPTLEILVQ